ncbi:MAG: elongation factor P 5-aminopentanone reductase [Christensenellales bacterium]|jgi:3-oxoacyl-[acyl-carrier protein] reductase
MQENFKKAANKKTAIITGASRGIGRSIAFALSSEGYNVIINYNKSEENALSLLDDIRRSGGGAMVYRADVADEGQVFAMVKAAEDAFGHIDLLVNNAGIAHFGLLTDMTAQEWRRLMAVNLDGAFHCCKAVLPGMVSRKEGSIVNISSIWGQEGASCEAAYSAAKAGLIGLTKALAKEVGPCGIRVNCVAPGLILTEMNAGLSCSAIEAIRLETPLETLGAPSDVADAVLYLASEKARFITGQVISVNGGLFI